MSHRQELVAKFAKRANVSRRNAGVYLNILLDVIQLILARKGELKLPGFGTFRAKAVPERKGTNPLTGRKVTFSPGVRVSFKPGRPLKEKVENGRFLRDQGEKSSKRKK